jgi:hypothetical protein
MKPFLACISILLLGAAGVVSAGPNLSYQFSAITFPGSTQTNPAGINDSGVISGNYGGPQASGGFEDRRGTYTSISFPGKSGIFVRGINKSGGIVGEYQGAPCPSGDTCGFVVSGGTFKSLMFPGGYTYTGGNGINDSGAVVGVYFDGRHNHGYSYVSGVYTSIDYPGATDTFPSGINNAGEIVGYWFNATQGFGFTEAHGQFKEIQFPGSNAGLALGINNLGQIVGAYLDQAGNYHGFQDSAGVFTSFDYPGATATWATGINDAGVIVGIDSSDLCPSGNLACGFVATPVE